MPVDAPVTTTDFMERPPLKSFTTDIVTRAS
jgi:hypothetical protein